MYTFLNWKPFVGKNESNFEKNIHLRKRLFFIIGYSNAPFFSSCASLFFLFSLSPPTQPSPPTTRGPHLRVPRNKFYFHSNSRCRRVKTHGGGVFTECGITRSNPPCIFESVFFAVVVGFFVRFVRIIIYTRIA